MLGVVFWGKEGRLVGEEGGEERHDDLKIFTRDVKSYER